jgi:hypothetical protein
MKKYLEFIKESVVNREITIKSENDFHKIEEGVEIIYAYDAKLEYLPKLPESLIYLDCSINKNLKSLPKLPESLKLLDCGNANLTYLPELSKSLTHLYCENNELETLPELPDNLIYLDCGFNELKTIPKLPKSIYLFFCRDNNLTSLPKLPENLKYLECHNNPLEYPIPHKFYEYQDISWFKEFNLKLSSYEHQKSLIEKNGIYIMKKFENHPELISDKIKEENPTYFLSEEYGF